MASCDHLTEIAAIKLLFVDGDVEIIALLEDEYERVCKSMREIAAKAGRAA